MGTSGAGKSTFLRLLNCLDSPWEGEIFFEGQKIDEHPNPLKLRRKMAMVFQEPLLFRASVFDNVAYGLKLRRYPKSKIQNRVREMLNKVKLEELAERRASDLSGGEAQRVAFARALVIQPDVIFLDEPFGSLDPLTKKDLKAELRQLLRELKVTAVYVTHDQLEAIEMADRLAVMEKGKILQIGAPGEIFYQPTDEFVAKFVGVDTILSGQVIKQNEGLVELKVGNHTLQAVSDIEPQSEVLVCIRPEDVTIMLPIDGEKTSARNHFSAEITEMTHFGAISKITLDCGFKLVGAITKRSLEDLGLNTGQSVLASIKATAIHVIKQPVVL